MAGNKHEWNPNCVSVMHQLRIIFDSAHPLTLALRVASRCSCGSQEQQQENSVRQQQHRRIHRMSFSVLPASFVSPSTCSGRLPVLSRSWAKRRQQQQSRLALCHQAACMIQATTSKAAQAVFDFMRSCPHIVQVCVDAFQLLALILQRAVHIRRQRARLERCLHVDAR